VIQLKINSQPDTGRVQSGKVIMAGKVLGAIALAAQLAKTKKGREYVMKQVKEKYKDFTDSQAGKIVDKAFQSLKFNKAGKPFGEFYKEMAKYQKMFNESAKKGVIAGARVAGPAGIFVGGAAVYNYKDDIDKFVASIDDITSGTASAKSASSSSSKSPKGGRGDGASEVKARAAEKKTFKGAFADARSAGKKTFTFEGERYTTEVAEGKKEKVPTTSKTKAETKTKTKAKNKVLSETDARTSRSYSKGGIIKAKAGASVPPNRMSRT